MPRGRPSTVRYFFDEIAGAVVAMGSGAVRVLKEIGGKPAVKKRAKRKSKAKVAVTRKKKAGEKQS